MPTLGRLGTAGLTGPSYEMGTARLVGVTAVALAVSDVGTCSDL